MSATKYTLKHPKKILERVVSRVSKKYLTRFRPESLLESYLMSLEDALTEAEKRRKDPALQHAIHTYLEGDIPKYFKRDTPVLYLSRHVPTPNEETLDFLEYCHKYNPELPVLIGQDTEDIFTGNNILKRNLGKMPITHKTDKNGDLVKENITIVDFPKAQGMKLRDITTVLGAPLVTFHTNLLTQVSPYEFEIADESEWVTRNNRGDLLAHYKKFLSLLVVHGIMFEFYEPEDREFIREILLPAIHFIEKKFGHTPLITRLVAKEDEGKKDWNGYPPAVYPLLESYVNHKNLQHQALKEQMTQ